MAELYLGRIVAAAKTPDGRAAALYRVSSRSFPNRRPHAADDGRSVAIVPKPGHEADSLRNPYVSYCCARLAGDWAVLTNGSHTDPAADMIERGFPARDALVHALATLDYEKDGYDTPRIAVATRRDGAEAWLAVVRNDGLEVVRVDPAAGETLHLSTNVHNRPEGHRTDDFRAATADEACRYVLGEGDFAAFTHPVCAVAAVADENGFRLAVLEPGA